MSPSSRLLRRAATPLRGLFPALALVAVLAAACSDAEPVEEPAPGPRRVQDMGPGTGTLGSDRPIGRFRKRQSSADPEDEDFDPLSAIGYSQGSQPAPEMSGVTKHLEARVAKGLNFFVSGHTPGAFLMDMEGNVLHRWSIHLKQVWPNYPFVEDRADAKFWRRAHLMPNGDVIAIFESLGIVKVDRDSKVVWSKPIPFHHDLHVMEDGSLVTLARTITFHKDAAGTVRQLSQARLPRKREERVSILEDFVGYVDPGGTVTKSFSVYDAFVNADPEHDWKAPALEFWRKEEERSFVGSHRDIYHTNSIEVLDGRVADRVPEFAEGNLLLSLRHLDMICVIDPSVPKVVWSMTGRSTLQHDAQIDSDGNLLYFDNQWRPGRTRIAIVDPATRELVWEYGTDADHDLYSETCGVVQELPNGNLLVSETDNGRALEVTREGEVVWEFYNPFGVGEDDELIASLFELVRLPADFPTDWLPER